MKINYKKFLYLIKLYYIYAMKALKDLTRNEYRALQLCGMLFIIYPEATGNYLTDCNKSANDDIMKVEQNDIEK